MNLTGSTLGQYQIHEQIGRGGMANVYRAVQTSIGRTVAIKVLPAHFLQDETFLERFMREVKVVSALQHPHILPVHDFGEQDGMPYIVMAYMPGGTLADVIRDQHGMPLEDIVRLVEDIASGLDYAHRRGIIHRDFKPSNVLLDEEGQPYLSDFGIAKIAESTMQLTGSGIVGTPAYMAPEMAEPGGVSPLVDVYALGVTLFQMVTGRAPYEADTPMGVLMAHASKPIPDARRYRPDAPGSVQAVIERAMAKDPLERYQSPREAAAALREAVEHPKAFAPPVATRQAAYNAPTAGFETIPEGFAQTPPEPARRRTEAVEQPPAPRQTARRGNQWLWTVGVGGLVLCVVALVVGVGAMSILGGPGLLERLNPGAAVGVRGDPTSTRAPTRTPATPNLPTPLPMVTATPNLPTPLPMVTATPNLPTPLPMVTVMPNLVTPMPGDLLDANWTMEGHDAAHTSANFAEHDLYPPLDLVWYAEIPDFYVDGITVVDGEVYLAGMESPSSLNEVVKLDANGSIEWRYTLEGGGGGAMGQTLAYYDGLLYFGGQGDTYLYGLNARTGAPDWLLPDVGGLYASSPTVYQGNVYAFGDFGIFSVDALTGSTNWYTGGEGWGATVAIWGDWAVSSSYSTPPMGLDLYTGEVLWARGDITPEFTDVIALDGMVYLGADYQVWALDLETGDTLWVASIPVEIEVKTAEEYNLALADGILYAAGGNYGGDEENEEAILFAMDARTGEVLWQTQPSTTWYEVVVANGVVYAVGYDGGLTVMGFDAYSGDLLWSYPIYTYSTLAVSEGRLYATESTADGMAVLGFE